MLLISAVVGSIRIVYGRTGRGIWDIVSAAIVAALVAMLLVSPVAAVTGEPLTKVRNAGLGIAALIDGKNIGDTDINATPDAAQLKPAPVLVDAFVRPAHGLINYGVNFTDDQKCTPAYDAALKAGPHFDPGADDQRKKVASCDKALGEYAEKQSVYAASAGLGLFMLTGLLVAMTILTGCVLLFISVMMLGWSLLKLVITGVIGIGPGDTRGPLVRNALTALASLLYVGTSTIVLALVLVLIKNAFATDVGNPMARFLLVDVILIGGLVIVIQTWAAHRRGAQSWTDKAMAKFQQSTPKPTIGSRVGGWLKAPAGGEAAKYGGLGGDSYGTGTGRWWGSGQPVRSAPDGPPGHPQQRVPARPARRDGRRDRRRCSPGGRQSHHPGRGPGRRAQRHWHRRRRPHPDQRGSDRRPLGRRRHPAHRRLRAADPRHLQRRSRRISPCHRRTAHRPLDHPSCPSSRPRPPRRGVYSC